MKALLNVKSLKLNSISNLVALGLYILVGVFLTPFIIKQIGQEGYGIWLFIISITGHYGLLALGISAGTKHYIAKFRGENNNNEISRVISTSLFFYISLGLFIPIITYLIADMVQTSFSIKNPDFKLAFQIIGFSCFFTFPNSVFQAAHQGFEKFILANLISIFITIVRTAITVTLLIKGMGILGIAISLLSVAILQSIIFLFVHFKLFPEIKLRIQYISKRVFKILALYGLSTMIIVVGDVLRFNLDNFVIGYTLNMEQVAIYGIGFSLVNYVMRIVTSVINVLAPRFSNLMGAQRNEEAILLFNKSIYIASILSFGALMMSFYFGSDIINLWVGDKFQASNPVLLILICSFSLILALSPTTPLLYSTNKHHLHGYNAIFEGILNLIFSLFLVQFYGINGIALGTSIAILISKLLVQPVFIFKLFQLSFKQQFSPLVGPMLTAIVLTLIFAFYNNFNFSPKFSNPFLLLLGIGIVGVLYLGVVFIITKLFYPKFLDVFRFQKRK